MARKVIAIWLSLIMVLGFSVIVVEIAPTVKAKTIYVGGSGPDNHSTIQEGVDAAIDGDTVFVYNGTYFGTVVVNKTINLTGEDRETTIIEGFGMLDCVRVTVDFVNISGFTIKNSGFAPPDEAGIELDNVRYCSIFNNNISRNARGICSYSSSNITLIDNKISNNVRSIYLEESLNISIINNNFINDGIVILGNQLSHFNSHNITLNNSVNGRPLLYYKDCNDLSIDGISAGQLILANCTNISVKNLQINNTDYGIEILISNNITITDTIVRNNLYGIYFDLSSDSNITGNNITSNSWAGIWIRDSVRNNVTINNIFSNEVGLSFRLSSFNNITNNNISKNHNGLRIEESSNNNSIANNNMSRNYYGMHISSSSYNVVANNDLSSSDGTALSLGGYRNKIIDNYISLNGGHGLIIGGSFTLVTRNNISINTWYGIKINGINAIHNNITRNNISGNNNGIIIDTAANKNKIFHNNIIGNTFQAYDDVGTNFWNDTYPFGGNYWSDYGGVDNYKGPYQTIPGSDGFGDMPYMDIDGGSSARDNYPLMEPYTYKPLENYTILKQGWNLISLPLIQVNQNLSQVLGTIDMWYDAVQWYDPKDIQDHWKHNKVGKPWGNDLFELNEKMGFWIHITQPGDTIFLYNGTQPTSNQTITFHPGWNMVGYPSLTRYNRTKGLNNLTFDTHVDAILTYNASTQKWKKLDESDYFELGRGYYIHAKSECEWEVPL